MSAIGRLGGNHVQEDVVAATEGLGEALLLEVDDPQDEAPVLGQLTVDGLESGV